MNDELARMRSLLGRAIDVAQSLMQDPLAPGEDFEWVALHHLAVASRDARGVLKLCDEELSDLALLLLRRLWENTIRLEYIRTDTETRSREFLEEAWVEDYRTMMKARRRAETGSGSAVASALLSDPRAEEKLRSLESLKNKVSNSARKRAESGGSKPLWKSRDMAGALGIEEQYDFLYSFLSQRGHAGADLVRDYWNREGAGLFCHQVPDYSSMALGLASAWLLHIMEVYVERYEPARIDAIRGLLGELTAEPG